MHLGEVGLRQVVDPAERLRRVEAQVEGAEHVGLGPADLLGDQGDDVTVAAMLAEHVGGVPQPVDGLVGHRERAEAGVHDPAADRRAGRGPGEVGGARRARGVDEVAEDPPQRCHAAPLARGVRGLRRGRVPDASGRGGPTSPSAKL